MFEIWTLFLVGIIGVVVGFLIGLLISKSKNSPIITGDGTGKETSYCDNGDFKMVLVVRHDLGMGKGKAAAQCCHAAIDCYVKCKKNNPKWLTTWQDTGCAKVALKCSDENQLIELQRHARLLNIDAKVICDAGRTQIPSGSRTVLGLGPAPSDLINKVTGHLKLF